MDISYLSDGDFRKAVMHLAELMDVSLERNNYPISIDASDLAVLPDELRPAVATFRTEVPKLYGPGLVSLRDDIEEEELEELTNTLERLLQDVDFLNDSIFPTENLAAFYNETFAYTDDLYFKLLGSKRRFWCAQRAKLDPDAAALFYSWAEGQGITLGDLVLAEALPRLFVSYDDYVGVLLVVRNSLDAMTFADEDDKLTKVSAFFEELVT